MIDSVPLIQNPNDVQQINASIIALKKASRELDEKIAQFNKLLSQEITNREKAITEAINSLDVPSVGGSGKYISAISETDGKISATESDITSSVSSGNSQPVTSGGVAEAINDIPYSKYTILGANADMNNCTDVGTIYYSGSTSDILTFINKPTFTNAGEMSLITIQLGATAYLMQLYFAKEGINNSVAKRVYNYGTWSSWSKILTDTDLTSSVTSGSSAPITSGGVYDAINPSYFLTPSQNYDSFQAVIGGIYFIYYTRKANATHGVASGASIILEQYSASNIAYIGFVKATATTISMLGTSNTIYYKRLA